jgi:pyridoxine kinase
VIGDVGRGVFVRPGIPEFLRDAAIPRADIATPNRFELEWLTGIAITDLAAAKRAIAALQARGPRCVLLTSCDVGVDDTQHLAMLAAEGGHVFRVVTPLLPVSVNGAGDAIAALFLLHRLRTGNAAAALSAAASSVFGVLRRTAEAGAREILTVAAQEEFVAPSRVFAPEAV